jgi:1,4-dihydroxy-2-naphthoate octaprenyltransferase
VKFEEAGAIVDNLTWAEFDRRTGHNKLVTRMERNATTKWFRPLMIAASTQTPAT